MQLTFKPKISFWKIMSKISLAWWLLSSSTDKKSSKLSPKTSFSKIKPWHLNFKLNAWSKPSISSSRKCKRETLLSLNSLMRSVITIRESTSSLRRLKSLASQHATSAVETQMCLPSVTIMPTTMVLSAVLSVLWISALSADQRTSTMWSMVMESRERLLKKLKSLARKPPLLLTKSSTERRWPSKRIEEYQSHTNNKPTLANSAIKITNLSKFLYFKYIPINNTNKFTSFHKKQMQINSFHFKTLQSTTEVTRRLILSNQWMVPKTNTNKYFYYICLA